MSDTTPAQPASPNPGRYSLADDGQIFLQPDSSNPLPGAPAGRIAKGASMLQPAADNAQAQEWLDIHVRSTLEPLFALKQEEGEGALPGVARDIGARLYEHLGVMHRADLEDLIAGLDPDLRKNLRSKGVRLGPVLAFLPALVKPAAIRMRAMLWALWNDKTLPIARPVDGRVSETVDPSAVDRHFYRMIGYPVFGPRAIRIDMLDRVVTDVYDTADKGVFEAKHKYAEWLGCNLADLHAVLESMGHKKLKEDPHPNPLPEGEGIKEAKAEPVADIPAEAQALVDAVAPVTKAPPAVVKFMLKRGKMSDRPQAKKPREKREKPKFDPNKPQLLTEKDKERIRLRDEERARKKPRKEKRERDDRNAEGRVYTFEGKKPSDDDDSNPFAVLKKLK